MRIISRIEDIWLEIKWGFQRMFRGYDDTAYWGLYLYLTDIIIPVLELMKEHKHGVPGMVCEDNETIEESMKRWNAILDKMILAFKIIQKDDWKTSKETEDIQKEGLSLFAKYYRNLWD